MDWILFVLVGYYFVKGYLKGFVATLFSLIGVFFVVIVSYKLTDVCFPIVQNLVGDNVYKFLKNGLDKTIVGTFDNVIDLKNTILSSNFKIFAIFVNILTKNITFDGRLTAGQILSPSLAILTIKVCTFISLFLVLSIILKLLKILTDKLVKLCGLSGGNKLLGGVLGIVKGALVFGTIYVSLTVLSNFLLNEQLATFVQSGVVSNYIYNNYIKIIINLFYSS